MQAAVAVAGSYSETVGPRDVVAALIAVTAVPAAVLLTRAIDAASAIPAAAAGALALAVAVSWPRARGWIAWPTSAVAVTSLLVTALALTGQVLTGPPGTEAGRLLGLLEVAGLLVLLALVVRWSRPTSALVAGGLTATAITAWILRFLPEYEPLAVIGGCTSMAVAPAFATVVGGLPRLAAIKLRRSLRVARQEQRLEIAHDLHDYVAHDVTGMVVQAQAARYAAGDDPVRLTAALERIETIGLQTLSAMDEMVAVLADSDSAAPTRPLPRLADLAEVVDRFESERDPSCQVEFEQNACTVDSTMIRRPVEATAHRVVVEALTNVRRHAPAASHVAVSVRIRDSQLVARVTNAADRSPPRPRSPRPQSPGGTGLARLDERVRAMGGDFRAGPGDDGGWVVEAHLPVAGHDRSRHG